MINYDDFYSSAAGQMQESAIRRMGTVLAQSRNIISFAPSSSILTIRRRVSGTRYNSRWKDVSASR